MRRVWWSAACAAWCVGCGAPRSAWWADAPRYMVAADHADASRAGAEILSLGGNAVDAAVATSFALAVVRPESCGLGGGGFMLIHLPGRPAVALDFREAAPAGADRAHYVDARGQPLRDRTLHGPWAVGVPGQIKGLLYALEQYGSGRVSREQVLAPARRLAAAPLVVDAHLHDAMRDLSDALAEDGALRDQCRALADRFLRDGRPYGVGERVDVSEIAVVLECIARQGVAAVDSGAIGRQMAACVQSLGGPLSERDLKEYTVRVLEPLRGRFGRYEVLAMPPPSSGGCVMLSVLGAMQGPGGAWPHWDGSDPATVHLLVEAMNAAFAERAAFLGDRSEAVLADAERLTAPRYAAELRRRIDPRRHRRIDLPVTAARDDGGTSHYCVVDAQGGAVAGTDTINTEFGSYLLVPGLGIVLNNQMDDFAVSAGVANAYGLRQSERNLIAPGRRPLSSMCPTIVMEEGRVRLVAGASGGPLIISATTQTLLGALAGGMSVERAVAAPRVHHQWRPDEVLVQPGVPAAVVRGLLERGHTLRHYGGAAGHVQAIARTRRGWRGACDPGKGGRPAGG